MPSLQRLRLGNIHSWCGISHLRQLTALTELSFQRCAGSVLPPDASAVGTLANLRKLSTYTLEPALLLPSLTVLRNLTDLSMHLGNCHDPDVPDCSVLRSLQHLTYLKWDWWRLKPMQLPVLSAICACSSLVHLELLCGLAGAAAIRKLAAMPNLRRLALGSISIEEPVDCPCAWEHVTLRESRSPRDLLMLPLASVRTIKLIDPRWTFVSDTSGGCIAAASAELSAAASVLSGRAEPFRLSVKWDKWPGRSLSPLITALYPVADCLTSLDLTHWMVDEELVQLLATFSKLKGLRLHDCQVAEGAWVSVPIHLRSLGELDVFSPISPREAKRLAIDVVGVTPAEAGEQDESACFSLCLRQSLHLISEVDADYVNRQRADAGKRAVCFSVE